MAVTVPDLRLELPSFCKVPAEGCPPLPPAALGRGQIHLWTTVEIGSVSKLFSFDRCRHHSLGPSV